MWIFEWKLWVVCFPVVFYQFCASVELEGSYHGCYKDSPDVRENRVSGGSYDINRLTPMQCLSLCKEKDYQYASLQKGYLCLCSSDVGSQGESDEMACSLLCAAFPTQTCGDHDFATIYSTSTSVKNFQILDPGFIELYKETTLEISLEAGSEGTVFRFNFGDGTLIGEEYDSPEPHIFMEVGMFLVIATARNNASGPIEARREVYVETPISDVGTKCNPFIEVDHTFECVSWAGQGTSLQITWNFNDGSPTTEFNIADAPRFSVGPIAPRRLSKELQELLAEPMGHVGVFIMPAYEFTQSGKIEAWEVYAVKEGQAKLQIYRPICGEEEKYCAFNRTCMSKYLPCPPVTEMACSNGTTFCVRNVTCAPFTTQHHQREVHNLYELVECDNVTALKLGVDHVNGTWCNVSVPYESIYDYSYGDCEGPEVVAEMVLGYKVAGETIVHMEAGYNLYTIDEHERLKVRPHDLIGYIPYDEKFPWYYPKAAYPPIGELAQVVNTTASQSVFFINQSHINSGDKLHPDQILVHYLDVEFYIRAIISKKTSAWMSHSYSSSEMFEVSVEYNNPLANPVPAPSFWIASQYLVLSIQGMDFTRDLGMYYACTDEPYEMHVEVVQGTFARFVWTFPDDSAIESAPFLEIENFEDGPSVKIPDKQSFHFDEIGNYSTHVKAYNNISEIDITLFTIARERITGLNGSFVLSPGDNTTKDWNLALSGCWFNFSSFILTGNEVMYKWTYGDGATSGDWSFDVLYEHYYVEPGTYTVEINSDNIASTLDHTFEVTAIKPNNVYLPEYGTSDIPVRMFCDVTWHSGEGLEFEWTFGDGETETEYNSGVIYHNYSTFNTYEVQCTVKNYPEVSDTNSIIIQDPVEGVELLNITEVLATTDTIDFGVTWTRGNDVHFMWYFGDGDEAYTDDPATTHVYEQVGFFDVTVNVSNVVSWMMSPPMRVEVQERISNVLIESSNSPIDVFVEIRVLTATGNKILYDYDFGDGFNQTNVNVAASGHSYAYPDTFTITVRAYNDVSEETAETFTQIDSLIGDSGLSAVSPHTRQEVLEAQCVAVNGSNVAMTFDWGDGTTSGPFDATYTSWKSFFTGTHVYETEGSYRIKCFMKNPFSDSVARVTVTVQNRITDVTFTPHIIVKGEMFQFRVNPFSGGSHNVSFSWDYGDSIHYDTLEFIHDYVYKDAGLYKVTLVARNLVSEFTTTQDFFVQENVEKLELAQDILPVEPGNPTVLVWTITHGTDVEYTLDTGDGMQPYEYLQADVGMYIVQEYVFPWPGSFTVTITAENMLNSMTITGVAHVEYPVKGLEVFVRGNSTTHTDKSSFVVMTIRQGTNVVYECDYQDGSPPVVTTHPVCKHAFIELGPHLVTVTASNHLSSVKATANEHFLVLLPPIPHRLRGLFINVSDATAFGAPTVLLLSRQRGNRRFNCTLQFGDGNHTLVDNTYFDTGIEIRHTYGDALIYLAELNCTNFYHGYVQGYTEVVIQHPIQKINITDGLFGEFGLNLTVNFTVLIGTDIDGLVEFNGVPLSTFITGLGGYAIVDSSLFNDTGYFNVTVTVWNLVTQPMSLTELTYIESRITNMRLWGDHPLSPLGFVITFCISMTAGSNVAFDWTLGTNYRVHSTRNATKWREKDCKQHLFTEIGVYAVYVVATNLLSVEAHEPITVVIQREVQGFILTSDSQVLYPPGNISFILDRNPVFVIPTNASVDITFGDETPMITIPLPDIIDTLPYNFTHHYEPGVYPFELVVWNLVSRQNFPVKAETQIPVKDCDIVGYNSARPGQEHGTKGGGPDNTYFPVEHPITFTAQHSQGTGISYVWLFGDGKVKRNVGSAVLHSYTKAKNYIVRVLARNIFDEASCEVKMHIEESVLGLYLAHSGPVQVNEQITVVLFAVQVGTNPTYTLQVSDGKQNNSVDIPTPVNDPDVIKAALRKVHPSFYLPFDPFSLYVSTQALVFTHQGDYPITAIGYNYVSEMRVTRVAHVIDEHCELPTIEIYGGSKNISAPWQVKRSSQVSIVTHVSVDCTDTTSVIYEWEIYVVRYHKGEPLPANQLYKYENIPSTIITDEANMLIPKRALDYGTYLFQLTVTMNNRGKVSNANQIYVEIEPSSLAVSISGGSSVVVGINDTITLDATASYDPDDEIKDNDLPVYVQHGLFFQWYCRLPDELFMFEDPGNSSIIPGDGPGCFSNGPGLFADNVTILHLNASELITNQEMVFAVVVSKPNSDVYREPQLAYQKIIILDAVPPLLDIRCLQNCGKKINPSKRLALTVLCTTCRVDDDAQISYNWTFSHDGKQIRHWENITSTGVTSSYLVIKANTLLEYTGDIITFQVSGDWVMASTFGVAKYIGTVSQVP
ncbi:polycystin-1-like [Ptychodera flava]|uniref:polycystin-1-like n=1 Tax=Ptychodera flava TaxID=63121 RepID=UPI003969C47A